MSNNNEKIYKLSFRLVYQMLVQKVEKKSRQKEEVDMAITWLTGYSFEDIKRILKEDINYKDFFENAPKINEKANLIKGSICGVKIENIDDDIVRYVRYLDKLVDEIAKGKPMEKVLRK